MSISETSLFVAGRKPGRPRLAEPRNVTVTTVLTEQEYHAVWREAKSSGQSISSALRSMVLARRVPTR